MVDKIHNILLFREMNVDGSATKAAVRLAESYRGKKIPTSSNSTQFCGPLNIVWRDLRGKLLSDQYSIHIEYTIACRVVYDLMISKLSEETVTDLNLLQKPAAPILGTTFTACVHDALERSERAHDAVTSPSETQDVAPEAASPPKQLEFLW